MNDLLHLMVRVMVRLQEGAEDREDARQQRLLEHERRMEERRQRWEEHWRERETIKQLQYQRVLYQELILGLQQLSGQADGGAMDSNN